MVCKDGQKEGVDEDEDEDEDDMTKWLDTWVEGRCGAMEDECAWCGVGGMRHWVYEGLHENLIFYV